MGEPRTATVDAPPVRDGRPRTVCEAFQRTAAAYPDRVAVRTRDDSTSITYAEYARRVRDLAAGLHAVGLRRGDTLALMLNTRPEFYLVDMAALHLGALPFSVYTTAPPADVAHVLGNSGARIAIVEDDFRERATAVEQVLAISELPELEQRGGAAEDFDFEAHWRAVEPDDLVTLIYTSGTTGEPKGVELTHRNTVEVGLRCHEVIGFPDGVQAVTYLPMAHVGDRNASYWWAAMFGFTVTTCPEVGKVLDYMRELRLHFVFGMPRLFEKLRAIVERDADPATRQALDRARLRALGHEAPEPDPELLARVREEIGFDRVVYGITGGAMTPPDLMGFLHGLGLPVCEVWGLSEATGMASLSGAHELKIGTAGKPLPGAEVRLDDDGELLLKSPGVMRGYRGRPELTAEAFTEEGWLRTGDIGELDDEGYISIVDRKKELIIGSHGKNMAPARIEARIKEAFPLIGGAVAVGDQKPYNVALIALDPDACVGFAREHGLSGSAPHELASEPTVREAVERQIEAANEHLSGPEKIKKFAIVPEAWLPGGDELTPTMKPKRRPILAKYAAEIEALYDS